MSESWFQTSQEDRSNSLVYVKKLDLIVPDSLWANDCHLALKYPGLISSRGKVDTSLIFSAAGQVLEAPKFIPSRFIGIQFEAIPSRALTFFNTISRNIEKWGWVAIIEAIGSIYATDAGAIRDYRYSKAVRIEEIRAYCEECLKDEPMPKLKEVRPMSESLKQGLAVERFPGLNGEGELGAICSLEKHPDFADIVRYKFNFSEQGEFILNPP